MVKKKGQTESYSFLVGLLIMILILFALGAGVYQFMLKKSATEKCLDDLTFYSKDMSPGETRGLTCQIDEKYFLISMNKAQKIEEAGLSFGSKCAMPGTLLAIAFTNFEKPEECQDSNCLCMCEVSFTGGTGQITDSACAKGKVRCEKFNDTSFVGNCFASKVFFAAGDRVYNIKVQKSQNGQIVGICDGQDKDPCFPEGIEDASAIFDSFVKGYRECKNKKDTGCLCDKIDLETFGKYGLKITNLGGKTRLELVYHTAMFENGRISSLEEPSIAAQIIDNDNFCLYDYDDKNKNYVMKETPLDEGLTVEKKPNDLNQPYVGGGKMQLFKFSDTFTCIAQKAGRREFEILELQERQCGKTAEQSKSRIAFLDLGDLSTVGSFDANGIGTDLINKLDSLLSAIGTSYKITAEEALQSRLERRTSAFNKLYKSAADAQGFLHDKVYVVSFSILYENLKDSQLKKDHIKVHYLATSTASEVLASKVKARLEETAGKYYKDGKEYTSSEVDPKYKMNIIVETVANSEGNPGPVFLACQGDYKDFPACKEKKDIPAIFIEATEVYGDGAYLFTGHNGIIAQKVFEGIKDYFGTIEPADNSDNVEWWVGEEGGEPMPSGSTGPLTVISEGKKPSDLGYSDVPITGECTAFKKYGESSTKADVLFVSDLYSSMDKFKEHVLIMLGEKGGKKGLFSFEPFKSNKAKFNIWLADGMILLPDFEGNQDISSFLKACPFIDYSVIVTTTNKGGYTSSDRGIVYMSTGPEDMEYLGLIFAHEFGHAFGKLEDEYVYANPTEGKEIIQVMCFNPKRCNCWKGSSSGCEKNSWWKLESIFGVKCIEGCTVASGICRAKENTLMRDCYKEGAEFGEVNEQLLNEKLAKYS